MVDPHLFTFVRLDYGLACSRRWSSSQTKYAPTTSDNG